MIFVSSTSFDNLYLTHSAYTKFISNNIVLNITLINESNVIFISIVLVDFINLL